METKINGIRVFDNYDVDQYINERALMAEKEIDVDGKKVYLFAQYVCGDFDHCATRRSVYDLWREVELDWLGEESNDKVDEADKAKCETVPGDFEAEWAQMDEAILQVMKQNDER